jgi:hypothetical protein
MIKENKCKICGWLGIRTHFHHIVPRKFSGSDNNNNLIELCPNCHADACDNEERFALKNNLIGEKISKEKEEALGEAGSIHVDLINCDFYNKLNSFFRLLELERKFKIDRYDYGAYMMGITRDSMLKYSKE